MTLILLSAPALSRPISWSAVGATAPESGPPAVLPTLLRVGPHDPSNLASRSEFRLRSPALAYMPLIDRALHLPCLYHRVGGGGRLGADTQGSPVGTGTRYLTQYVRGYNIFIMSV